MNNKLCSIKIIQIVFLKKENTKKILLFRNLIFLCHIYKITIQRRIVTSYESKIDKNLSWSLSRVRIMFRRQFSRQMVQFLRINILKGILGNGIMQGKSSQIRQKILLLNAQKNSSEQSMLMFSHILVLQRIWPYFLLFFKQEIPFLE